MYIIIIFSDVENIKNYPTSAEEIISEKYLYLYILII